MTSKEALNILWDELELYYSKHNDSVIHYWNLLEIIKEDLDRIEQLEIANKNNENLVKENVRLVNENLSLKDKLNTLKIKENKYE